VSKTKITKIFFITVTSLIIITITSAILLFKFFPREKIKNIIITNSEKILHRKVTIGKVDYNIHGINVKNISIYSKDKKTILIKTKELSLGYSLRELFNRRIKINNLKFTKSKINLIFQGDSNNISELLTELKGKDKTSQNDYITKIDMVKLKECEINIISPPKNISPIEGKYLISANILFVDKGFVLSETSLILPKKRGEIKPEITIYHDGEKSELKIDGKLSVKNLEIPWVYYWLETPKPYKTANGEIKNLQIKINKNSFTIEGFAKGTSSLSTSKNVIFGSGFVKFNITKKTVFVSNTTAKIASSSTTINSMLVTFNSDLLSLDLKNTDVSIVEIRPILYFLPIQKLYGRLKGNLSYTNSKYNASLKLLNFGYNRKEKTLSNINTDLIITNSTFKKEKLNLKILNNPATISIATLDKDLNSFYLYLYADNFNYSAENSGNSNFSLPGINLKGKIKINNLQIKKNLFKNVAIDYSMDKNKILLNNFVSNYLSGNLYGKASFSPKTNLLSTKFQFSNIKVQDFSPIKEKFTNRFFGISKGKASISFNINNVFDSIKGNIEFFVDKGKIINTGIQSGLGIWLSDLKYKLKDLEFSKIYGNFNLTQKTFYIKSFIFKSQDIRLKLKGELNDKLFANNAFLNLEFTKNFIEDIPSPALSIFLRRRLHGRWYIIPFLINGNIKNGKNIKLLNKN